MNLKRIAALLLAVTAAASLYGCGDKNKDSQSESESSTVSLAESQDSAENEETEFQPSAESTENTSDTEGIGKGTKFYGHMVDGRKLTGFSMYTPYGMNNHNGNVLDDHSAIVLSSIPTASDSVMVMADDGSNINIFAAKGEDASEFKKLKQKDVEETFLSTVDGVFDKCEISSFEQGEYDGYPGIKMIVNSEMNGLSFKQTIYMIDAVDDDSNGFAYTITYTDMTGEYDVAVNNSIESLNFDAPEELAKQEADPDKLAEIQKKEAEEKASKLTPGRKAVVTGLNKGSLRKTEIN